MTDPMKRSMIGAIIVGGVASVFGGSVVVMREQKASSKHHRLLRDVRQRAHEAQVALDERTRQFDEAVRRYDANHERLSSLLAHRARGALSRSPHADHDWPKRGSGGYGGEDTNRSG